MHVRVVLIDPSEITIEGHYTVFGDRDFSKGYDASLRDIGFYLDKWRYTGRAGPPNKGWVFIPWSSALYIIELK